MSPNEKFKQWLEENNFVIKANVSIDHDNKVTAWALLHFAQGMWVKLTPILEIVEKPSPEPEVVPEVLPE